MQQHFSPLYCPVLSPCTNRSASKTSTFMIIPSSTPSRSSSLTSPTSWGYSTVTLVQLCHAATLHTGTPTFAVCTTSYAGFLINMTENGEWQKISTKSFPFRFLKLSLSITGKGSRYHQTTVFPNQDEFWKLKSKYSCSECTFSIRALWLINS